MSDKLLDPKEAAARLNITEEQVRAFARDGDLKFINMGRGAKRPRYRFRANAVASGAAKMMRARSDRATRKQQRDPRGFTAGRASETILGDAQV